MSVSGTIIYKYVTRVVFGEPIGEVAPGGHTAQAIVEKYDGGEGGIRQEHFGVQAVTLDGIELLDRLGHDVKDATNIVTEGEGLPDSSGKPGEG
jgi:hypothetical protein